MNNKSFIQGMLYAFAFSESVLGKFRKDYPVVSLFSRNPIYVWFKDGSRFDFVINRGISHVYGNMVAMLTQEESCNLFDIAGVWITPKQVETIQNKTHHSFEESEIRVNFEELIEIINLFGEIDYELTQKNWLEIALKKYIQP